jgi:hypothetical protein
MVTEQYAAGALDGSVDTEELTTLLAQENQGLMAAIAQLQAENQELKDGLYRIIQETRLGDVAFGIACEVMGEFGVQQELEEQQP